jgi:uncharacterized protein YutE (UPF0331/DUF86 family)
VVREEVIRKRLGKLDEYLSILRGLRKYTFDEFIGNPEHYGSTERFLHLAIEMINDMGNHVIAEMGLGSVNWYSDIPSILEEKGYIDSDAKETWIRMIGFRNALVHDYLEIDRRIVYDVMQNNLKDIEALKKLFVQFM